MIDQATINKIKETVKDFFEKATFSVEAEVLPEHEQTIPINITTEEPQILIGEGGQTLAEIQHLLKLILKRKLGASYYIDLDINNYKKKKIKYLKEIANSLADEVSLTKKEKSLASMPAYERRVIHLELAKRTDVVSESTGEEPDRRIVIKPARNDSHSDAGGPLP